MQIGSKTDKGRVREQNEDCFGYRNNLFVVADGMGGHEAGEVASAIAVQIILNSEFGTDIRQSLKDAVLKANDVILKETEQHPEYDGMGTTIAVLVLNGEQGYLAHIGDSRIYIWSNGELQQITKDHSLVAELVKNGGITEEEAKTHPQRNVLTRALGTQGLDEVEIKEISITRGDKLLLCTDGLSGLLDDNDLKILLNKAETPQDTVNILIDTANERGGPDNITVILIEV
jgi:PPM family protein phosphatase